MQLTRGRAGTRRGRSSGISLLEVTVSLGLMLGLLVPIYLLFVRSREHAGDTRHRRVARAAAEHQVERMREAANKGGGSFAALATTFAGYGFHVPGLPARKDGTGLPHGLVEVILDEKLVGLDLDGADSDGDGDPKNDVLDPTARYRVLPVRVSVWWGLADRPQVMLEAVVARRTDFLRTSE